MTAHVFVLRLATDRVRVLQRLTAVAPKGITMS